MAELSQWLCDKDELLSQMQTQLKEAPRREQELRKKYESNPTVKIMQEQINNAKVFFIP